MVYTGNKVIVQGWGRSNRQVVLNEIREMRQELSRMAAALNQLEATVRARPEGGEYETEDRMANPLLTLDQIWPLVGWLLSIYESFYMIGHAAIGREYARKVTKRFSEAIHDVEIAVSYYR